MNGSARLELESVLVETQGSTGAIQQPEAALIHQYSSQHAGQVTYRALQPGDFESLRKAHYEMFPVDYEDAFFERVVHRQDGLESLAAVSRELDGCEQLIGFVTTRAFHLYECDPTDRQLLGLGHRLLDNEMVSYILTLGVAAQYRHNGIASALIQWVVRHARLFKSRAVYLHVIAYNTAAIALYRRHNFHEVACRKDFYMIWSGRQPDPTRDVYDAYLYAFVIDTSVVRTPATLLLLAFAPMRGLLQSLLACLPWATPRGKYFGTGQLPALPARQQDVAAEPQSPEASIPAWLLGLFSRKRSLY